MLRGLIALLVVVVLPASASAAPHALAETALRGFDLPGPKCVEVERDVTAEAHPGKHLSVRADCIGSACSGKEADDEVGVVYFGERYLIPRVGRWASPDPLHVHAVGGGEALNSYHYVAGNMLQARDPVGLDPNNWVHNFDNEAEFQEWQESGADGCPSEAMCVANVGNPESGLSVYVWDADSEAFEHRPDADASAYYAAETGTIYEWAYNIATAAEGAGAAVLGLARRVPQIVAALRNLPTRVLEAPNTLRTALSFFRRTVGEAGSRVASGLREAGSRVRGTLRELHRDTRGSAGSGARSGGSTTSGASNRALHERYVDRLRAAMERPHVHDSGLSRIMDDLYRPGARIGSGSTAAAVRHEAATGARVGGRLHTQKAQESITRLQRWLDRNPTARSGDRAAAENVLRDLQNALGGN